MSADGVLQDNTNTYDENNTNAVRGAGDNYDWGYKWLGQAVNDINNAFGSHPNNGKQAVSFWTDSNGAYITVVGPDGNDMVFNITLDQENAPQVMFDILSQLLSMDWSKTNFENNPSGWTVSSLVSSINQAMIDGNKWKTISEEGVAQLESLYSGATSEGDDDVDSDDDDETPEPTPAPTAGPSEGEGGDPASTIDSVTNTILSLGLGDDLDSIKADLRTIANDKGYPANLGELNDFQLANVLGRYLVEQASKGKFDTEDQLNNVFAQLKQFVGSSAQALDNYKTEAIDAAGFSGGDDWGKTRADKAIAALEKTFPNSSSDIEGDLKGAAGVEDLSSLTEDELRAAVEQVFIEKTSSDGYGTAQSVITKFETMKDAGYPLNFDTLDKALTANPNVGGPAAVNAAMAYALILSQGNGKDLTLDGATITDGYGKRYTFHGDADQQSTRQHNAETFVALMLHAAGGNVENKEAFATTLQHYAKRVGTSQGEIKTALDNAGYTVGEDKDVEQTETTDEGQESEAVGQDVVDDVVAALQGFRPGLTENGLDGFNQTDKELVELTKWELKGVVASYLTYQAKKGKLDATDLREAFSAAGKALGVTFAPDVVNAAVKEIPDDRKAGGGGEGDYSPPVDNVTSALVGTGLGADANAVKSKLNQYFKDTAYYKPNAQPPVNYLSDLSKTDFENLLGEFLVANSGTGKALDTVDKVDAAFAAVRGALGVTTLGDGGYEAEAETKVGETNNEDEGGLNSEAVVSAVANALFGGDTESAREALNDSGSLDLSKMSAPELRARVKEVFIQQMKDAKENGKITDRSGINAALTDLKNKLSGSGIGVDKIGDDWVNAAAQAAGLGEDGEKTTGRVDKAAEALVSTFGGAFGSTDAAKSAMLEAAKSLDLIENDTLDPLGDLSKLTDAQLKQVIGQVFVEQTKGFSEDTVIEGKMNALQEALPSELKFSDKEKDTYLTLAKSEFGGVAGDSTDASKAMATAIHTALTNAGLTDWTVINDDQIQSPLGVVYDLSEAMSGGAFDVNALAKGILEEVALTVSSEFKTVDGFEQLASLFVQLNAIEEGDGVQDIAISMGEFEDLITSNELSEAFTEGEVNATLTYAALAAAGVDLNNYHIGTDNGGNINRIVGPDGFEADMSIRDNLKGALESIYTKVAGGAENDALKTQLSEVWNARRSTEDDLSFDSEPVVDQAKADDLAKELATDLNGSFGGGTVEYVSGNTFKIGDNTYTFIGNLDEDATTAVNAFLDAASSLGDVTASDEGFIAAYAKIANEFNSTFTEYDDSGAVVGPKDSGGNVIDPSDVLDTAMRNYTGSDATDVKDIIVNFMNEKAIYEGMDLIINGLQGAYGLDSSGTEEAIQRRIAEADSGGKDTQITFSDLVALADMTDEEGVDHLCRYKGGKDIGGEFSRDDALALLREIRKMVYPPDGAKPTDGTNNEGAWKNFMDGTDGVGSEIFDHDKDGNGPDKHYGELDHEQRLAGAKANYEEENDDETTKYKW